MKYRQDPPGFLVRTRRECGPIFQLNLAGKKMILVCGQEEQRQLANAPESIMSLRKAVGVRQKGKENWGRHVFNGISHFFAAHLFLQKGHRL